LANLLAFDEEQSMKNVSKKGTKLRLLFGGGETQITHVISLKRSKNVPFWTERVFLKNIEKGTIIG